MTIRYDNLTFEEAFSTWVYYYLAGRRIPRWHGYPRKIIKLTQQLEVYFEPPPQDILIRFRDPLRPIHLFAYKVENFNRWCKAGFSWQGGLLIFTPRMLIRPDTEISPSPSLD